MSVLSALTDKIDARRIVLFGLLISIIAPIGFSLTATGLVTASLWWGLQGVGFAGIYMPGLKALNERVSPELRDHAAAIFTATFTVGVSISFSLTGILAELFGWRGAFLILNQHYKNTGHWCIQLLTPFTMANLPSCGLE